MGGYQNQQPSQLSPVISQGSPAPPSYQTNNPLLPQVSPTGGPNNPGQIHQGQQSPAWSSSPQHRNIQQQNPILNAQLTVSQSFRFSTSFRYQWFI